MSFPRAKIQRFNDVKAYTPSPADYNVLVKEKKKGCIIGSNERFTDPKSPTLSDNGSVQSTPCFRTPNKPPILQKKSTASDTKAKTKPKELFLNHKDLDLLKEKMVECENKDLYIKDLTEQLEYMKNRIADLEIEKSSIESEKISFEKQTNLLKCEHNLIINNLKSLHETELHNFRTKVLQALEELSKMRDEYNEMNAHYKQEIEKLQNLEQKSFENMRESLESKNQEIENKERELALLKESWYEIQQKHELELEQLRTAHREELHILKQTILEGLYLREKNIDALIDNKNTFAKEVCTIIKKEYDSFEFEFNKKLSEEIEKQNSEHQILLKEKIEKVEIALNLKLKEQEERHEQILRECQAISEYNIIQTEIEKNEVKKKLHKKEFENTELSSKYEELSKKYTQLVESYEKLQDQTSKIISEIQAKNKKLIDNIASKEMKISNLVSEKHTYEITIQKCQETIQVLTKRLINSDKDVEQLKNELHSCETKLLTYEEKCMLLNSEVQELKTTIDELEMQTESTLKLTESDITNVKQDLLQRLEHYKQIAETQLADLQDKLFKKEAERETLRIQLQQQHKVNSNCQILVDRVEAHLDCLESENCSLKSENNMLSKINKDLSCKLSSYEQSDHKYKELEQNLTRILDNNNMLSETLQQVNDERSRLKKQLQQTQEKGDIASQYCDYYKRKTEECETEIEEAAEMRKKYIEQSGKYDDLSQKFEILQNENSLLKKTIADQDSLIGPFREQLEKYELEKKSLMSEKDYIENEAKEIGMKYAEILGHHNPKQKIKHLINLKLKNEELTKDKLELESKLRCQAKQIEKMKKENADLRKSQKKHRTADKENFSSPNVSLNSSKLDSPGPLRERN